MGSPKHVRGIGALGAALRSFVLPGWGHLAQGRRDVGWLLIGLTAVITGVVGLWLARDLSGLAELLVQPPVLRRLLIINAIVLVLRLAATADAWRTAAPPHPIPWLVGIIALVAVPHVAVGWTQARTYDVLTTVFTTTTTATATETTTSGSTGGPPTTADGGVTVPTTAPTTTTTAAPTFGERLTVLLLGGDAGPGRTGIRTDTMIVATLNTGTGDVALFGLPRNLKRTTFSDGSPFDGILNEVYGFGVANPGRFPGADPGAAAIIDVAETLTGLPIDHYALVDLNAFVDVVDALGGVDLYVPQEVYDPGYPLEDGSEISIRIPAGQQELSGTEALAYVRIRYGTSDYDRMARQRCLITALADQIDAASLVRGLPGLLTAVEENVRTDIPIESLPELIRLAGVVDAAGAIQIGFDPPDWNSGRVDGGYPVPNVPKIQEAVALVIADPTAAREAYQLEPAEAECAFNGPTPAPTTTTTTTSTTTTVSSAP